MQKVHSGPNYIGLLTGAFDRIESDVRLTPFHVSLYMALFRCWNRNYFRNPIPAFRDELIRVSKIGSVNTYVKCLKELDEFGFIRYKPSHSRSHYSMIYLYSFDTTGDTTTDTTGEFMVRRILNNTDKTDGTEPEVPANRQEEKIQDGRNRKNTYGPGIPPLREHVGIYFDEKGFEQEEADRFFNYYESTGWLVGGRTKMKDWKAAARNWILNSKKYRNYGKQGRPGDRTGRPGEDHGGTHRDYSEPL